MDIHINSVADCKKGWISVLLDDGSAVELDLEQASLLPFALHAGRTLDDGERDRLSFAARVSAAKTKAADCLAYGDMSRRALEAKLAASGFGREEARAAAGYYEERGVIDDLNYAVNRAQYMKDAKNYGPSRIRQALYEKGVSPETIGQALEQEQFADFSENLDSLLRKKYRPSQLSDKENRQKAFRTLMRCGYGQQDIAAAIIRFLTPDRD